MSRVVSRPRSWANSVAVPVKMMRLPTGSVSTRPFINWPPWLIGGVEPCPVALVWAAPPLAPAICTGGVPGTPTGARA
ncbi:hypothetical protein D9M69_667190 [compost metagenome]